MHLKTLLSHVKKVTEQLTDPEGSDVEVGSELEELDLLTHTLAHSLGCDADLSTLVSRVEEVAAWGDEAQIAREHLVNQIVGRAKALCYPPARLRQVEERVSGCGMHELLAEGHDMDRQFDDRFGMSPVAQLEDRSSPAFVNVAGFRS